MLKDSEVLRNSGLIIIEKDDKGNIVRPTDKKILKEYNSILIDSIKVDDDYFDKKNNKWYQINTKSILDTIDNTMHSVTYIYDITNYKLKEKSVQIDNVTKLYNRTLTNKTVDDYIKHAIENRESFSILLGDLDGFKQANDLYGHPYGDEVLRRVGEVLLKNTRSSGKRDSDIVGRFGGDEFFILLKNSDRLSSIKKAEVIKEQVEKISIVYDGKLIDNPTMSIGIYNVNGSDLALVNDIDDFRSLIYHKADKALYYSKGQGKNKVTDYKQKL